MTPTIPGVSDAYRVFFYSLDCNEPKHVHVHDGRTISIPLAWSWRLSDATPEQRGNFRLIGDGQGIHWPDVDEDISIRGMLYGVPAHRPGRAE